MPTEKAGEGEVGQRTSGTGPSSCSKRAPHDRLRPLSLRALPSLQVNEIYHDESLGAHINIALVRLIMVGYRQVSPLSAGRLCREKGCTASASSRLWHGVGTGDSIQGMSGLQSQNPGTI